MAASQQQIVQAGVAAVAGPLGVTPPAGPTVQPGWLSVTSFTTLNGWSGATRPTMSADGTALPAGSIFVEQDTGARYLFDGQLWRFLGPGDLTIGQAVAAMTQVMTALQQAVVGEIKALKYSLFAGQPTEAADLGLSTISDPSAGA